MNFLANLLSFFALSTGYSNTRETYIWFLYEPECPKDLL